MDSVTQVALGSAVGFAALGSKIGRRALLVGACFGTLPDLDVLIDFGGAVENFVYHRSFSHSLIIHALLSPIFAWLLGYFSWAKGVSFTRLSTAIFLILSTHALLDSFTVYGTQLLWPLTDYPFGISSVFIIDPAYTLPLLISLVLISFIRNHAKTRVINHVALSLSSLYLLWGVAAKLYIDNKIEMVLSEHSVTPKSYVSTPAPFNTLVWRAIATNQAGHYELYASIFDSPEEIDIRFIPTRNDLLPEIETSEQVVKLKAFTKGAYGIYLNQDEVIMSDLRMGLENFYVFSFVVGQKTPSGILHGDFRQLERRPPLEGVHLIFDRVNDPNVDLFQLSTR